VKEEASFVRTYDMTLRMRLLSKSIPMSELIDRSFIPPDIKAADIK
jgi:hypothetical protein